MSRLINKGIIEVANFFRSDAKERASKGKGKAKAKVAEETYEAKSEDEK